MYVSVTKGPYSLLSNLYILFLYLKMRNCIYDFLGHLKAKRGERLPLWLWRLMIVAVGNGFHELFLPVSTENKHPEELPLQLNTARKVGVLFISSFFLLVRYQLCECANQIPSYKL